MWRIAKGHGSGDFLLLPRSLNAQLRAALLLLFMAAAGSVGFTLYELDLRKHDYVILNLSGQLRAIAQNMVRQGLLYKQNGSSVDADEETLFSQTIREQRDTYEHIVASLSERLLPADLTGRNDPLRCSWDEQSIAQLNLTARTWHEFRQGLDNSLDANQPTATADYILANAEWLMVVSKNLSNAFQLMMESKMELIALFNKIALGSFFVIIIVLLALFTATFTRPLRTTLSGIQRISQGEFGYQLPSPGANEIGQIAHAFNGLSCRLHALFRLTDQINRAASLDESLQFVFAEFRALLPLEWIAMISLDATGEQFVLERCYAEGETRVKEGERFAAEGSLLARALLQDKPLYIDDLERMAAENPQAQFAARLCADGYRSVLFFPLGGEGRWSALLAFAARERGAYNREHLELLGNIAAQVSHSFEKTVVTENLVISAITGLASLAESRDPETGDHLLRMARYSAMVAEELGREGKYADQINGETVRAILSFAPMHDIGKVGIEDRILLKPGRLDEVERSEMERHPLIGAEVLRRCEAQMNAVGHSVFQIGIEIAESHHEKYDGSGYPHGLTGEAIPLAARIVAVADVFDALTSRRPYKEAWPVERALSLLQQESGHHFDPLVVAALQRVLPRIMVVYERHKHV
jgi:HD-GYP domain-containing protein (c-di-GMP phosphodiesterase class II)/HAMP domain-containing protein